MPTSPLGRLVAAARASSAAGPRHESPETVPGYRPRDLSQADQVGIGLGIQGRQLVGRFRTLDVRGWLVCTGLAPL